jgi:spore coat protein JB
MAVNNNRPNQNNQTKTDLATKIQELSFVQKELELYLDTHPGCKTALDYYYQTVEALDSLTEEYEAKYAPLTSRGVMTEQGWTWVNEPWPWQRSGDFKEPRKEK